MAYTAPYTRRKTWADYPTTTTPILAADLNAFEDLLVATMIGDEAQGGTIGAPTSRTVWKFQPKDTAKGPFQLVIGGSSFSSTWDTVMYLGYNVTDGGGRALTSEPLFFWGLEQDYNDGTKHVIECYWNYTNSAGTFNRRPIMFQVNRATDANTQFELSSTSLTFSDWATGTQFANMSKAGFSMTGFTGLVQTLAVGAAASQGSAFQMQYNAANRFTISQESVGAHFLEGVNDMTWYFSNGRVSWFGQDNSTAKFVIIGDTVAIPTLALKLDASQADSPLAVLSSAGAKLTHINKAGYIMTRLHAAPADADVATGEVALWFDQTIGATKLMVKGKDSGGTVRTATIAMA